VVGGGIAGLAAAWELTGGASGPGDSRRPAVIVLEADRRLGGKIRTEHFCGRPVDVGPDGFLGRRPEAAALCRELGLGPELEPIGASGAAVWARGTRRPLPAGLFLGVPTRFLPVARSGILSPLGTARLLADLVSPRTDPRGPLGDRAIGPLVTRKLGRQVVGRLVEPLLGGIYAGGVSDASAAAVLPALLKVSHPRSSFMRGMGRLARSGPAAPGPQPDWPPPPPPGEEPPAQGAAPVGPAPGAALEGAGGTAPGTGTGTAPGTATAPEPAFWALRNGLGSLVDRLASALVERGVDVRTGCRAAALRPADGGWQVQTGGGTVEADGVVLALPAQPAAELLAPLDADAASMLMTMTYASVAVVTLQFPADALPHDLYGTGLLVPRGTALPAVSATALDHPDDDRCMVTACTYLSTKWPHLAAPGDVLVRASVGRFGDERFTALDDGALVDRVVGELAGLLGATRRPTSALVTRWLHSLPQYRVHHLLRVGGVESSARRLGALAVAGAAYRGVGIPACIGSGRSAAWAVLDQLGGKATAATPAGARETQATAP
jgi:oxygen-dependent protoporphyrinogen oxidase